MRDALDFAVEVEDVIAVIDRSGNGAKYVFGTLLEFDEVTAMFRMRYPDGKVSKWRQQYFYDIRTSGNNKVLRIKTRKEVMDTIASIARDLDNE